MSGVALECKTEVHQNCRRCERSASSPPAPPLSGLGLLRPRHGCSLRCYRLQSPCFARATGVLFWFSWPCIPLQPGAYCANYTFNLMESLVLVSHYALSLTEKSGAMKWSEKNPQIFSWRMTF